MKKYIFIIILLLATSYTLYAAVAQVKLETGLPTIPSTGLESGQELPSYIKYLFLFGLSFITIVALGQMIIGGIMYILAAGNAAKVEDAKDTIYQALFGLGILLVSYLLLHTINPDLVNLRNPTLTPTSLITPTIITEPSTPPIPGVPSVLIYNVTSPGACADNEGKIFSPCQTYCLATPGLCGASTVCCGTKP